MKRSLANYFVKVDNEDKYINVKIDENFGNIFKISIDGKQYEVDYAAVAQSRSFIVNNVSYGVEINKKNDSYEIIRADDFFTVEVLDEMRKFIKERVSAGVQGRQVIDTQMPGLILKVLIEEGQEVKKGDPLLILVAMKMENEIKSPKDGVVQELFVSEGMTVSSGDKLAVID